MYRPLVLVQGVSSSSFGHGVLTGMQQAAERGRMSGTVVVMAYPGTCRQRDPHLVDGVLVLPTYSVQPDEIAVTSVDSWIEYFVLLRKRNHYTSFRMVEPEPGEERERYAVTCHILNDDEREAFPELREARCVWLSPAHGGKWNGEIELNG